MRNWHDSYGKIEDYTISGCVRNPWDRATSYYFYLGNTELKCDKFQKSVNQLSPQTNYYTIDNVNKLNSAISYENLQTDFDKFCDTVGISKEKLPKANVSKKKTKHFMEYFEECPDVNELVKSKFENDIKIFGY